MEILKHTILLLVIKTACSTITVKNTTQSGCESTAMDCSLPWVIDVLNQPSKNPNETEFHHLWGSIGAPTLITAQTSLNASLTIDWEALSNHSSKAITFDPEPINIFGVSITQVILFNDVNDTGSIESVPLRDQIVFPSELFNWQYNITQEKVDNVTSATASLYATSFNGSLLSDNGGVIAVIIKNSDTDTRESKFPQLQVKPSASNVDIVIDHVTPGLNTTEPLTKTDEYVPPIANFSSPRWAIKLVMFSSEVRDSDSDGGFEHAQDKSQDDEYSPGVFKLDEISTPRARNTSQKPEGGYMQWRPVCYYTYDRDVTKSTLPTLSAPKDNNNTLASLSGEKKDSVFVPDFILQIPFAYDNDLMPLTEIESSLKKSLAYSVFGDDLTDVLSSETLVSFGAASDGFYTTFSYSVWTFTTGSGTASQEKLSVGVLLALLLGVALPMTTLLVAGFFVKAYQCKQRRQKNNNEGLIENEEVVEET